MTAKNAVNALYKIFAGWLAPEIRVNCVVPGFVKTDMFRHHPPESWQAMSAMVPMQGMADPFDVAKAALYLASDDAKFVTGVNIPVDGGRMSAIPRRAIVPLLKAMKPGTGQYEKEKYGKENSDKMDAGL
jgi:3-oxoacyl-[acyl-carrier protein] reductase